MKARKYLSVDGLLRQARQGFGKIIEHRPLNVEIPLDDALMSGLDIFSLKDPSLLAFDQRRAKPGELAKGVV